jgi:hypothetical protein
VKGKVFKKMPNEMYPYLDDLDDRENYWEIRQIWNQFETLQ